MTSHRKASHRKDRPGYKYRKRTNGSLAHYWDPKRACRKAPSTLPARAIPDGSTDEDIARICQAWTDELLADLEMLEATPAYDGTIGSLITLYMTDAESPYQALKHPTKIRDYQPSLRLISRTVGKRLIVKLTGADFRRWYREWAKDGKIRRAHGAIRKLRSVMSYGAEQRLAGCGQAREILSLIRFCPPGARASKMEYAHARAICEKAIELKRPSIALTQAIQWDTALRRIHVIGEWLPVAGGDEGGIVRGRTKWRGVTVADLSADLVLTVPHTSRNKVATRHDLKACPLVMWVLDRIDLPKMGPLIVSEKTGLPYRENYYASDWREIATAAEIPNDVWSMDSRAGAISETEEAMDLDSARKLAGHTNARTTLGYVRNDDLEHNRKVAAARSQLRK
ncbi:hypothetical protein [Pararhizobium haloflavum]|uniref:hypothetical protein n=1 Tax=Pararhizobium haloflavum TaxID=2037914 RepID=UPI0012FFE2FC|nr:hypothetical protein [Pararhizobium haloflavum]